MRMKHQYLLRVRHTSMHLRGSKLTYLTLQLGIIAKLHSEVVLFIYFFIPIMREGADSFLGDAGGVLRVFASVGAAEAEESKGDSSRKSQSDTNMNHSFVL